MAGQDHVDALGQVKVGLWGSGGMGVRLNIQCFYAREFVPLACSVLVAFNMFPDEREREPFGNCYDLACNVMFWAQSSACKNGRHGDFSGDTLHEALVVDGNAEPRFSVMMDGDGVQLKMGDKSFQEHKQGELTDTLIFSS
jgi:hypothetical protein